jgi:hypothetical protein
VDPRAYGIRADSADLRADASRVISCRICLIIHHLGACWAYGRNMPSNELNRRVATAVRLPEDVHKQLQEHAEMRDVSVNWLVTRAVEQFLSGLPSREQVEATLKAN